MSHAITRDVTIVNQKGLHARAAAKLVKLCGQYKCDISVSRNGVDAPGRSILDLLMLAASQGKSVTITCDGSDAPLAMEQVADLIRRGFDEEQCGCDITAMQQDAIAADGLQHGCCRD